MAEALPFHECQAFSQIVNEFLCHLTGNDEIARPLHTKNRTAYTIQLKTTNQLQALHDGRIHLGIVRTPVQSPFLNSKVIQRERFVVALPQAHPLANHKKIHMKDLIKEDFIVSSRNNGSIYHDAVIHLCYQAGYRPKITLEAPEILTIVAFVSTGMGVALVPDSFRNQQNKGVIYQELDGVDATLEMSFVWRKNEKSQVLQEFLHFIELETKTLTE
jgi:DNA-binding transcriptional LysR family regulator